MKVTNEPIRQRRAEPAIMPPDCPSCGVSMGLVRMERTSHALFKHFKCEASFPELQHDK